MSEWVDWIQWGAPEVARRVAALDPTPGRSGHGPAAGRFAGRAPARHAVIALAQDAARIVREREAMHRGVLRAGLARLGMVEGCAFLAATAAEVERADFEVLWGTGRALTLLLARCDQVEGLAEPVRVLRDCDPPCPECGHGVVLFDGERAACLRCRASWVPVLPPLRQPE